MRGERRDTVQEVRLRSELGRGSSEGGKGRVREEGKGRVVVREGKEG